MLSLRDPPKIERYTQTKSKEMEKDISCKWKEKKAGVAIFITDKIDFKTKSRLVVKMEAEVNTFCLLALQKKSTTRLQNKYCPEPSENQQ